MNHRAVEEYILGFEGSELSYLEGKKLSVYSLNGEMFALAEKKKPVRLSLRCDRRLANILKEQYEEVMPGHNLNKSKWITITLTGQLSEDEIKDLIRHSYFLVKEESS